MRTREEIEAIEDSVLAPYSARARASEGRAYPEAEHAFRTAFQRDRDRIVHTAAFRRLEYKTQVFVNHEGDSYRTRLTHTLEVSQIARTVARALGLNEDLTDAVSLAHDLGHTPFGHTGQDTMASLMKDHGGFEHNRQSFRIVTRLESPNPAYPGLNLTAELLEGIAKHAGEFELADGTPFVRKGYPSIEAQVANLSDEIAYNNHDLDDGLKSGLLEVGQLRDVALWEEEFRRVKGAHPGLPVRRLIRLTVRALINAVTTDLIENTAREITARGIKTFAEVRANGGNLAGYSPPMKEKVAALKRFLFTQLYRHWRVERMGDKARRILTELFQAYTRNPAILPADFTADYAPTEPLPRIVCDYIAGMTDRYALQEHARLFDPTMPV